jgi:AraC-like DNA-binding protein
MQYTIDLFAVFIFLGIVQGIFLLIFFLSSQNRKVKANLFHGLMLLSIVASVTEIFLMHTGYIVHCLFLVDFSEPFGLAIGPCFYLLVLSLTQEKFSWKNYLHLLFPVVYFFLELPFLVLPEDAKYNAWIGSYHPDWEFRPYEYPYDPRLFWVTDQATEVTLVSLALYSVLGLIQIFGAFKRKKEPFWRPVNPILRFLRWEVFTIFSVLIGIVMVKLFFKHDTGDHLFASYITLTIYFTSFRIIQHSGFFKQASLTEPQRYKGSTVTAETQKQLLAKLNRLMLDEKPFLKSDFSLPDLAQQLGTSVHILSQAINEGLGKSFFEMVAEYRVEQAKQLLKDQPNIKVEEIAEQVGYNSKSSFNTVFKKLTGTTPSEFRSGKKDRL